MARRASVKHLLKAQERFKAALTQFVVSKGARPGRFYDYELDTPAGLLHITVYGNWIACRFEDVEKGRQFSGCSNPYSGKWNHHYFGDTVASIDPAIAIADFGSQLERLLEWKPVHV